MNNKVIKLTSSIAVGTLAAGITYFILREDDLAKCCVPIAFGVGCVVGNDGDKI